VTALTPEVVPNESLPLDGESDTDEDGDGVPEGEKRGRPDGKDDRDRDAVTMDDTVAAVFGGDGVADGDAPRDKLAVAVPVPVPDGV
jgi:hypothetical protein